MTVAMISRRRAEPLVFFPWERKGGLFGALGRRRARLLVALVLAIAALVAIYENGERAAAVRATRATLTTVRRALDAYRADHAGACPRSLGDLVTFGYVRADPVDAWGRALRLVCPGRRDPLGFDLSSDGPDGLPGGLDQVQ
jgi:general secretion pathway protein G